MFSIPPLGVASLAIATSLVLVYRKRRNARQSYPPGPKGYPLIGNVLDIPQDVPVWKTAISMGERYSEWFTPAARAYEPTSVPADSDVVYLNVFGADHIILNSNEAISDLLDKRSAIYSDRVRVF